MIGSRTRPTQSTPASGASPCEFSDEIYTFKETYSRERQHILISIDLEASKIESGFNRPADNDYAVSWLNKVGEGNVFYCCSATRNRPSCTPS